MGQKYTMEEIVTAAKVSGFIYQGSEIYGGLANSWDYGPLGSQMKKNIKDLWWKNFIQMNPNNLGLDSSILMNPKVWEASGHVGGFSDPLIDCKECKQRFRVDKLIEESTDEDLVVDGWDSKQMIKYLEDHNIVCPVCKNFNYTGIRQFDLMFKTNMGVLEDESSNVYLRPENAQGIFVNFKNIQRTSRKKLPFGVGQIGKSFRNEITPGNFIFRTREFEQMELEFFINPNDPKDWFGFWQEEINKFLIELGIDQNNFRVRKHSDQELAHYASQTIDYEFKFPFGWGELWGLANRGNYDLKQHQDHSNEDLTYRDPQDNSRYLPHVIEPSVGVDRLFLSLLVNGYHKEELEDGQFREVLKLSPKVAPITIAVLPLVKKLSDKALEVFKLLSLEFNVEFDFAGKIGKRYRRYDAIGTPWCLTFDYDSLDDKSVTIRDRDSMEQKRIEIDKLVNYFKDLI